MRQAFFGGMMGVFAGAMVLVACGGGSGGGDGSNQITADELEVRVGVLEAQNLDGRLAQVETDTGDLQTDLTMLTTTVDTLTTTVDGLPSLRMTCHESETFAGPFVITGGIGGAEETLKELTFTPSATNGMVLLIECRGEGTPQAFIEATRVRFEVIPVFGSEDGPAVLSPTSEIRAADASDLDVAQSFESKLAFTFSNPLPDSYRIRLFAFGSSTDWVGDASNISFKVIETETGTTTEADSTSFSEP